MTIPVIRYVVTHIGRDGARVLSRDAQGRNTFATEVEATNYAAAIQENNSGGRLSDVFGPQAIGTFEARPCPCWPEHFDPMRIYFD